MKSENIGWSYADIVSRDGTRLSYKSAGTGPTPLLFVHGWASTKNYFDEVLTFLDLERFRVIATDMRGHGQSGPSPGGFGLSELTSDLAAIVATAEIEGGVVIGHSMGAKTALNMLAVEAKAASGVVLVAGAPASAMPITEAELDVWASIAGDPASIRKAQLGILKYPVSESVREEWIASAASIAKPVLRETLAICYQSDIRQAILSIQPKPATLIVAARHDAFFPIEQIAADREANHPEAAFISMDCGHEIPLERPGELANIVTAFAAGLTGRGSTGRPSPTVARSVT